MNRIEFLGGWNYERYVRDTAEEHYQADLDCGRPWQCACAACIQVREGLTKSQWLRKLKGENEWKRIN